MELIQGLLYQLLKEDKIEVTFPGLNVDAAELLEIQAVKMLEEIIAILRNDALSDPDCFQRIESIVDLFERNNISCGSRHDFG